jgi:tRNA-specific 2-thiouridylase
MRGKVLAAMSGGVDSSVAALLLAEAGFAVTGVTMCLGVQEESDRMRCCGREAIGDARTVCDSLRIPHYVIDFAEDLRTKIIEKFIWEYGRGRTPNPCIDCNRYLKFGRLLDIARATGFDYLATGHYARIERNGEESRLMRAKDRSKDQTYFLYPIAKENLPQIVFPLAGYTKEEVRAVARRARLPVVNKAESQDICFVAGNSYHRFIHEMGGGSKPGPIVDMNGREVGRHSGIAFFTVGQRRGLAIAGKEPLYVVTINAKKNQIVVGTREDLKASILFASDFNFLVEALPDRAEAKIRYGTESSECTLSKVGDRIRVAFLEPQESITPGQAVVLYRGEEVLGGGVIDEVSDGSSQTQSDNRKPGV